MKKKLFFAAVVATALAGCSSNENLENDLANVATSASQQEGRVPVVLGLNNTDVQVLKTRGTGTVGAIEGASGVTNIYRNEDLWVLMTTIGKTPWDFTNHAPEETNPEVLGYQFDGTFKARPYGYASDDNETPAADPNSPTYGEYALYDDMLNAMRNDGKWGIDYLTYDNNKMKYYPMDGTASDFFAFHVDDAATMTPTAGDYGYKTPVITKETAKMTVDFKINGSQDLLAGRADNGLPTNVTGRNGFTQKTARENLVPSIPMKHLLTRLTFDLVPGHQDAEGVIVTKIVVKSKSQGTLTVAYDQADEIAAEDLIKWDANETEYANFELKNPAAEVTYAAVSGPEGNPSEKGYYELDGVGTYTASTDVSVQGGKTYYEVTVGNPATNDAYGNKNNLVPVLTPFDKSNSATYLAKLSLSVNSAANPNILDNGDGTFSFTAARMGEAMFVQPNQKEFEVTATMLFPISDGYSPNEFLKKNYTFYVRIPDATEDDGLATLKIGNSYNVKLVVYGLSKVALRTTLEEWKEGGNIEIDTDDPTNTQDWKNLPYSVALVDQANDDPSQLGLYEKNNTGDYSQTTDTAVDPDKTYYQKNTPLYFKVTPTVSDNPVQNGWYEFDGTTYTPTTDTSVQSGKTYYQGINL